MQALPIMLFRLAASSTPPAGLAASVTDSCCRRILLDCRRRGLAASSNSAHQKPPPPPREAAKQRTQDNAPLYQQMRSERRGATERLALEKRRASLRRAQFQAPDEVDGVNSPSVLQAAQPKTPAIPSNCLGWKDYALFADPPVIKPLKSVAEDGEVSFAAMLRRSSFVGLGDFENRTVCGRIFERYEGNLYVDFGGKFHAVCPTPRVNADKYVRGAQVTLRLLDPEMTSRFLGSERHVTLAEADAVLLGLQLPDGAAVATADAASDVGEAEGVAEGEDDLDSASPLKEAVMQLIADQNASSEVAAEYGDSLGNSMTGFDGSSSATFRLPGDSREDNFRGGGAGH